MRVGLCGVTLMLLVACGKSNFTTGSTEQKPASGNSNPPGQLPPPVQTTTTPPTNPNISQPVPPVQDEDFVDKLPDNAIQKGSFAVWTMPADPRPWEDYTIFVAIDLPNGTSYYPRSDISGEMMGTDGYKHIIGKSVSQEQFVFDGKNATLSIRIPGAEKLVRDTIRVHSNLLNEEQSIAIIF